MRSQGIPIFNQGKNVFQGDLLQWIPGFPIVRRILWTDFVVIQGLCFARVLMAMDQLGACVIVDLVGHCMRCAYCCNVAGT